MYRNFAASAKTKQGLDPQGQGSISFMVKAKAKTDIQRQGQGRNFVASGQDQDQTLLNNKCYKIETNESVFCQTL